jgi:hypothetical protein
VVTPICTLVAPMYSLVHPVVNYLVAVKCCKYLTKAAAPACILALKTGTH